MEELGFVFEPAAAKSENLGGQQFTHETVTIETSLCADLIEDPLQDSQVA